MAEERNTGGNSRWHPVGIELPPGWKDVVADVARRIGCPMRYVWMASVDGLLSLPDEEIERRVIAYEMLSRKDFESLTRTVPGSCHSLVSQWASDFAASLRIDPKPEDGAAA